MRTAILLASAVLASSCVSRIEKLDMTFARSGSVENGQTSISWNAGADATCTASGAWSGTLPGSGTRVVDTPAGTTEFAIDCSNGKQQDRRSISVTVPTLAFTADRTLLRNPTPVALTWTSAYAASCTASDDWSGALPASGTRSLTFSDDTVRKFTITCSSPDTSVTASASVRSFTGTVLRDTGSRTFTDGTNSDLSAEPSFAPGQDASRGADTAGGDPRFIKVDVNGTPLEDNATYWSCLANPKTGLYYEQKFEPGQPARYRVDNIRRSSFFYGWFNGAAAGKDAGDPGTPFDDQDNFVPSEENNYCSNLCCYSPDGADAAMCNSEDFTKTVNSYRLCGRVSWRLPTVAELREAINYNVIPPTSGEIRVFTSETSASNSGSTFCFHAQTQAISLCNKSIARQILLVSDGAPIQGN